ncbi:MAG TPA: DMT family transporter [Acetobacteraceae bacterium]|nr:DMT family transporter [Acetobacteraceae bacterium]
MWICAGALLLVWVAFHLMSRFTTQQALTAWDVAALRYAGAFLCALPLLAWHGLPRLAPGRAALVLVFAGFGFPLGAYAGYQLAPAAHGATVMAAGLPVVAALLGAALRQSRLTGRRALSLATVVAGSLLLGITTSGVYAGAWRGDLLFLAAVSSWAVFTVLVQRWQLSALDTTLAIGLLAAPIFLPVWWLALPSGMSGASWQAIVTQLVFQGAFASVIAGILYTRCVTALGPGTTTMIGAAVPALAALLAWPLLGEVLPVLGLVAIGLVTAGLLLAVGRDRRPEGSRVR